MNYIPTPKSVELHLSASPEFSRYSKKVKALGGQYSECRGNTYKRFVDLPWTEEGRALANKLIAEFGYGKKVKTTAIVRGVDSFRGKHVHAWVIVHKVDCFEADPCRKLLESYEAEFLKAFPEATEPEPVAEPKPPVLRANLSLDSRVKFHAVLEALQQYIDNGEDAVHLNLSDDDELQDKLAAASDLRDQLDAVLASLAR